jgi:hypothetical protein
MRTYNRLLLIVVIVAFALAANAQQKPALTIDSLAAGMAKMNKTLQTFEKLKFSGYIQAQYQFADTLGAKSYEGGDFAAASAQRFMVRRGYFKVSYTGNLANYVLQLNVTEKGVNIRDAYFVMKDPWLKAFSLTGGVFYRPFGYEISYSAHLRESPELARVTQVLMPGERDLGASLLFRMPQTSKWHPISLEAGLFNGNGPSAETDDKLDFIGRLGYADSFLKKKLSFGFGVSYYNGSVYQAKKDVYQMADMGGVQVFNQLQADTIVGSYFKREYVGFDAQFSVKTAIGTTTLRGDFTMGTQPGSDKSSVSPTAAVDYSLYMRKFSGYVVYFVQSIPKTTSSIVIKYDYYDPNTSVKGDEVGLAVQPARTKATNGTDIAYTTWGFGWFADFSSHLRCTVYYDLVKNEISKNQKDFNRNLKDNVFTARVQYKF